MKKDNNKDKAFEAIMFRPMPIEHEPKRPNRFILEFPEEFKIEPWIVQALTRPKINLINGNYVWENIQIKFLDIIPQSTSNKLFNIVEYFKKENSLFSLIKSKLGLKKEAGFTLYLKDLDPVGVGVGGFKMHVRNIVSLDFGRSDYSSSELLEIELVLEIQDCEIIQ